MGNGDVYNSDKIVNNVEVLAQSSANFALTYIIFRALICWVHCAVIFAIAQFSCCKLICTRKYETNLRNLYLSTLTRFLYNFLIVCHSYKNRKVGRTNNLCKLIAN